MKKLILIIVLLQLFLFNTQIYAMDPPASDRRLSSKVVVLDFDQTLKKLQENDFKDLTPEDSIKFKSMIENLDKENIQIAILSCSDYTKITKFLSHIYGSAQNPLTDKIFVPKERQIFTDCWKIPFEFRQLALTDIKVDMIKDIQKTYHIEEKEKNSLLFVTDSRTASSAATYNNYNCALMKTAPDLDELSEIINNAFDVPYSADVSQSISDEELESKIVVLDLDSAIKKAEAANYQSLGRREALKTTRLIERLNSKGITTFIISDSPNRRVIDFLKKTTDQTELSFSGKIYTPEVISTWPDWNSLPINLQTFGSGLTKVKLLGTIQQELGMAKNSIILISEDKFASEYAKDHGYNSKLLALSDDIKKLPITNVPEPGSVIRRLTSQAQSSKVPRVVVMDFDSTITKHHRNEYQNWSKSDSFKFRSLIESLKRRGINVGIASASSKPRIVSFLKKIWPVDEQNPFRGNILTPSDMKDDWPRWWNLPTEVQSEAIALTKILMLDSLKEKYNVKECSSILFIDDNAYNVKSCTKKGYNSVLFPVNAGVDTLTKIIIENFIS